MLNLSQKAKMSQKGLKKQEMSQKRLKKEEMSQKGSKKEEMSQKSQKGCMKKMAQKGLMEQDLRELDVTKLHPLSPEVISRQATINIGNFLP